MKNSILLAIIISFFSITVTAQESKSEFIYAELVGTQKFMSKKVTVKIDYGQKSKFFSDGSRIVNASGKVKTFNSMVDALNFMGEKGWEFVQAYVVSIGNSQNVYHWMLKIDRTKVEGDVVPKTRDDFKQKN